MNIKLPSWLIYILYGAAGIAGIVYDIGWARNLFVFYTWVGIILTPLIMLVLLPDIRGKCLPKIRETYGPGKRTFSVIFSTGVFCLLVAAGYYITGFLYLLTMFCMTVIYHEARKSTPLNG